MVNTGNKSRTIAHKGYAFSYPENTMSAFRSTLDRHASEIIGIEMDVQLSQDGRIVIWHDENLKAIVSSPLTIRETGYDTLAAVTKAHPHFKGEPLGTLDDLLTLTAHRTTLYIEIKAYSYDAGLFCNKMADLLAAYNPQNDIVIHSFSPSMLTHIMKAAAGMGIRFGFLFGNMMELASLDKELLIKIDYLHPLHSLLASHGEELAARQKRLNVWTPNTESEVTMLRSSAAYPLIDGIITDNTQLASLINKR